MFSTMIAIVTPILNQDSTECFNTILTLSLWDFIEMATDGLEITPHPINEANYY
jgi:hypothetical protein